MFYHELWHPPHGHLATSAVLQVDGAETIRNKKTGTQSAECPHADIRTAERGPVLQLA